jgi:putative endonuclease
MFYVYVLLSEKDGLFYTGATADLKARFEEHQAGRVASTKNRLPVKLIYYEACHCQSDAFRREKYLKSGPGKRYVKNRIKSYLESESLTG